MLFGIRKKAASLGLQVRKPQKPSLLLKNESKMKCLLRLAPPLLHKTIG